MPFEAAHASQMNTNFHEGNRYFSCINRNITLCIKDTQQTPTHLNFFLKTDVHIQHVLVQRRQTLSDSSQVFKSEIIQTTKIKKSSTGSITTQIAF